MSAELLETVAKAPRSVSKLRRQYFDAFEVRGLICILLKLQARRHPLAVCSLVLKMLATIKMLVRFQMNFNLSCNPDFAQTLTKAAMITTERSAADFGLTAELKTLKIHNNLMF